MPTKYPALTLISYRSHWATTHRDHPDTGLLVLVELPPTASLRQGIKIGRVRVTDDGLTPSQYLRTWAERCSVHPPSWPTEKEARTGLQETIGQHLDVVTSHPEVPPPHPILS